MSVSLASQLKQVALAGRGEPSPAVTLGARGPEALRNQHAAGSCYCTALRVVVEAMQKDNCTVRHAHETQRKGEVRAAVAYAAHCFSSPGRVFR